jgi:septum formation protein
MIVQHLASLSQQRIVLASASPRRQELLHNVLGLNFEVLVSSFEENLPKSRFASAADYATATATHKAVEVASTFPDAQGNLPALIIGADTVCIKRFLGNATKAPRQAFLSVSAHSL